MAEVWDLEDKENMDKVPVCARLYKNPQPYFKRVYRNKVYDILQVLTPEEVSGEVAGEQSGRSGGEGKAGKNGKKAKKKESPKN